MICYLLKRRRRVTACRGGCNGNALSTCSCTRISLRRRIILTKTGQQHGKSTGSRSNFHFNFLTTNCIRSRIAGPARAVIDQKNNYSFIKVNIMNLHFLHLLIKNQKDEPGEPILVTVHEPPHNSNEGSEFLDDALRMKDQPLLYIEESVEPEARRTFFSVP
jgi:hypothetical protein